MQETLTMMKKFEDQHPHLKLEDSITPVFRGANRDDRGANLRDKSLSHERNEEQYEGYY